jgi:hypothetical protein
MYVCVTAVSYCVTPAFAQPLTRSTVKVGYGVLTFNHTLNDVLEPPVNAGIQQKQNHALYVTARFEGKKQKAYWGFTMGYDVSRYVYDKTGERNNLNISRIYTFALEIGWNYTSYSPKIKLYGGLGIGRSQVRESVIRYDENRIIKAALWNFQLTPFGLAYGTKAGIFFEMGYGYKGIITGGGFIRW